MTTVPQNAVWLVRWRLQGEPRLLPWDMFAAIPERAFELVEPLHGECVFFTRLADDRELAIRTSGTKPERYTCWTTTSRNPHGAVVTARDSTGRVRPWRKIAHAESAALCLGALHHLNWLGAPPFPAGSPGTHGPTADDDR